MNHRAEAKTILANYFKTVFRLMGVRWEWENMADVDRLIDAIFEGVKREMAEEKAK